MACSALFFFIVAIVLSSCHANNMGLDFHHRFSDKVREWTDSRGLPPVWKPEEVPRGSLEYYRALLNHDLHRHHGRSLAAGELYDFAEGNKTKEYLGHLHYAFVDLGTPNQTFFVALDTGSDLFWVPCNCLHCASNYDSIYQNMVFNNYMPSASTTSKKISCSSNQCFTRSTNSCTTADCTYFMECGDYSTSSGTLVQDDLYLIKQDMTSDIVKLPIVFGCGQNQTGNLFYGGAPNGLMGLSMSDISVPSILASNGLISDSFSMCFGTDGNGRLNFGDRGSADQYETSLKVDRYLPSGFYEINLTEVAVGSRIREVSFTSIVDSGTTFSGFTPDVYRWLSANFEAQFSEPSIDIADLWFPFDYCYQISRTQNEIQVPSIYFTTEGGSSFQALYPTIFIFKQDRPQRPFAYCLAILEYGFNIIGENFLVGQRIVFDRERQVLGWKPYNCSTNENTFAPAPAPSSPYSPVIPIPTDNGACSVRSTIIISVMTSLILVACMGLPFY